jgi:hypothetical protein
VGIAQVGGSLPSKCKVLNSDPTTTRKQRKEGKKEGRKEERNERINEGTNEGKKGGRKGKNSIMLLTLGLLIVSRV